MNMPPSPTKPLAIKAALLDLDGTLIDTVPDLHAAACAMLKEMGRPIVPIEQTRAYVGKGMKNLVKRLLAGSLDTSGEEPSAEALASFRKHYSKENGKQAKPYPGAIEGLEHFRQQGIKLAIVTNKPSLFTHPLLEQLNLSHYFEEIISGDSLPKLKPDPMPITWACGKLGVCPDESLFIGDSINDFEAARAASCPVFMLPYGYNEGKGLEGIEADAIVPSILDAAQRTSFKS